MKTILKIIFIIIAFCYNSFSQQLLNDDFQYKSDHWYWRSDGNQEQPTVKDGQLILLLKNAINTEYCNTEIYNPTELYTSGTEVRIRLKCSEQHNGSRGWGFWDGDLDGSILTDFDVAWIMEQGSDRVEDQYNWFLFGSGSDLLQNRQTISLNKIVDETNWYTYKIKWLTDSIYLYVNDTLLFSTNEHIPDENMRLDVWVDNRVTNINFPIDFWNNDVDSSKTKVDFIEISGINGSQIERNKSGNIILWESPNSYPNGNKNTLWKQYNFSNSMAGEALIFITGSAESYGGVEDDDDLKIVLDNIDFDWNSSNSLNGNLLNGRSKSISKRINISEGNHTLNLYSDITPFLKDIIVVHSQAGSVIYNKSFNETASGPDGLWKSIEFNNDSLEEITFLISGTGLNNDEIQIELDNKSFGLHEDKSINGNALKGIPNTIVISEEISAGNHSLRLLKKGNPELLTVAIYGSSNITGIKKTLNNKSKILIKASPNPFNNSTKIHFNISEASNVKISIINLLGQNISTLVDEYKVDGNYIVNWNPNNINSGIYFCQIQTTNYSKLTKLILLK